MKLCFHRPSLKLDWRFVKFEALLLALVIILVGVTSRTQADSGNCGGQITNLPFTDVMGNPFFCSIAQVYFQGLVNGTTPTTYSPTDNVSRDEMAAFLARTQDSALRRGSQRAGLNQFWTTKPKYTIAVGNGTLGTTAVGDQPRGVASDGADVWVANANSATVSRVRASDGKLLGTWTGAIGAGNVLVAMGRVFVTASNHLYMIDPSQPPGAVTTVANLVGGIATGIAFDGGRIWVTHGGSENSVSIITLGAPSIVFKVGGFSDPSDILYDGTNIWVTNYDNDTLVKVNANGQIIQTIAVGTQPSDLLYDGTNIWVVNSASNSVTVVRPADGLVLATLTVKNVVPIGPRLLRGAGRFFSTR